MQKAVTDFTVISNKKLTPTQHLFVLQAEEDLLPLSAGQFVNIEIPGNKTVFLRRPFSIFDADPQNSRLSLLVKILGRGSLTLTGVRPGEKLNLVYPLGKGFTLPQPHEKVLAIGGGSGVAPVIFLAKKAGLEPGQMNVLTGARNKSELIPKDLYSSCATFFFTTEDGSFGEKGLVSQHPLFNDLSQFDKIYACGPLPMMKEVAARAARLRIYCEVSLENLMACGFGVCLCCIEPTIKGNICVCTEGPVFNINDLKW